MNQAFIQSAQLLIVCKEEMAQGSQTPSHFAQNRELALKEAIHALGRNCGVALQKRLLNIDAIGEIHIRAQEGQAFGRRFAGLLNSANPLSSASSSITLSDTSSWCYLNHSEAENLVLRLYAQYQTKIAEKGAK